MAAPADAIYVDGQVRPLGPDRPVEALAVRDGRCCRLADTYEVRFLEGIETDCIDLAGRTVLPGFEAHVDLLGFGQRLVSGDLPDGTDRESAVEVPSPATVADARSFVDAALNMAARRGVTTLHAAVADPLVARAVWERDHVPVRLRLHYVQQDLSDLHAAVHRLGLVSGAGGPRRSIDTIGARVATSTLPDGRPWITPDGIPDFLGTASEAGFGVTLHAMDDRALEAAAEGLAESALDTARLITDVPPSPAQLERLAAAGALVVLGPGAWSGDDPPPVDRVRDPGRQLRLATDLSTVEPLALLDAIVPTSVATGTALRMLTGTPADAEGIAVGEPADFLVLSGSLRDQSPVALDVDLTVSDGRVVAGSV